jgi:hypothetical protein
MQIPCVYLPGPAPAVSVANNQINVPMIQNYTDLYQINVNTIHIKLILIKLMLTLMLTQYEATVH